MPLMDGADLLDQVKQRFPDMVRMILSGQSSQEAVFRSISPAHQFLSKPCDLGELSSRLNQAFAMRDLLANEALKTVISRLRSLPSLPALYDELTAALRSRGFLACPDRKNHLQGCGHGDQDPATGELRIFGD